MVKVCEVPVQETPLLVNVGVTVICVLIATELELEAVKLISDEESVTVSPEEPKPISTPPVFDQLHQ